VSRTTFHQLTDRGSVASGFEAPDAGSIYRSAMHPHCSPGMTATAVELVAITDGDCARAVHRRGDQQRLAARTPAPAERTAGRAG
jgi:hypothetical protein